MRTRKYFVVSLLVIVLASSWLVLNAVAQDQPGAGKEADDSAPAVSGCAPQAAGGPDAFGYTYRDSFQLDGPDYDWVEISSGTPYTMTDDEYIGPFPIGFPFVFYGAEYEEFYFQSNGAIHFDDNYLTLTNDCPLPMENGHDNLVALMWDDLDPGDTNDPVYYHSFPAGACPYGAYAGACLVVEYYDFCHYPGGASCAAAGTFEAILFDNGNILVQFKDAGEELGLQSTTGIENADGTSGLAYACNTAVSLGDERAILFDYPAPDLSASRKTATANVELGDTIDYTIEIATAGHSPAASAVLTDVLPLGTTFVPGSLSCSTGTCWYEAANRAVYWHGTLGQAQVKGYRPTEGQLLNPQHPSRTPQVNADGETPSLPDEIIPAFFPPGTVLESFTNGWQTQAMGLVYNPSLDLVRYAHEQTTLADIWDISYLPPHTVLGSLLLSTVNPGWPTGLNQRNGIEFDPGTNTYFLPDYNGTGGIADDNIIEIAPDGTILNAWELGDAEGSNDSYDGRSINLVGDIAIVPGTPPRYFAAASGDGSIVYELDLIKTGAWWTPDTWGTVMTCTVPGIAENRGIDYDAEHGLLYHSDRYSTNIVATDLGCHAVITSTCESTNLFNTGITYIEGQSQPEIWVTDFDSEVTTRCAVAGGPPCDQSATLFSEDFEAGLGGWTTDGLWNEEHETDTCGALVAPFPSPDTDAYFGLDASCTYSTSQRVTGTLSLALDVDLTGYRYASLNFWSFEDTECPTGFCNWDRRYVDISTDGGDTWATIWAGTGPESAWYQASANLAKYTGGPVRVRFRFDSVDSEANNHFGWMVDNVEIVGCPQPVELTFSVEAPDWCGPVANQAVLSDPQAQPVTLTAFTQVSEDLFQTWDFELDDGGFERSVPGEWEWGTPTYPPGLRAHSGDHVWGTDLQDYANNETDEHRLTRSVTLPVHPNGVYLEWWDWNGAEASDYIAVVVEGVEVYGWADHEQRTWKRHVVDLSAWAGLTVDIEFVLFVTGDNPGPDGWYIDDVAIRSGCTANAVVSPPSLSGEAVVGRAATVELSICSTGTASLSWYLTERLTSTLQLDWTPAGPRQEMAAGSTGRAPDGYQPALTRTRSLAASPLAGSVAIFKDTNPWGVTDVEDFLAANSIPFEVYTHSAFTSLDFTTFDMIVFSGDQPQAFYDAYAVHAAKFVDYVEQGGFLNFFAADLGYSGGQLTATLPGGMSWNAIYSKANNIEDLAHPVVLGLPDFFTGSYASHGYFTNLPAGAHVIASIQDTGQPTIVEYPLGAGWLIAFGQPLEIAHFWEWQIGAIMENTLLWGYNFISQQVPWLAEAPTYGSALPGACSLVPVTMDAASLAAGEYHAWLWIYSNDADTPVLNMPVVFTVTLNHLYLPLLTRGP